MTPAQRVTDPVLRCSYEFEWEGEVLIVNLWAEPGAATPEHLHPGIEERFEIIEGEFTFTADGAEQTAGPGDRVTVPAGVRHKFENRTTSEARFRCEIDPGKTMQGFFEDSSALARAGKYNAKGRPTGLGAVLDLADFAERYRDVTVTTSPPQVVQRLLVPPVAWLARRRDRGQLASA